MFKINTETGVLEEAEYCHSEHHNERPADTAIDMIVIHNISLPPGEFGTESVKQFFKGELNTFEHPYFAEIGHLRVSSHLFIRRNGEIIQFVPFNLRAWHAGVSLFQGKTDCNDFSIGIELEGTDDLSYEPIQYEKLIQVIQVLMRVYPGITTDRIVGHSDIAPGRKTDPGPAFDWDYLRDRLLN